MRPHDLPVANIAQGIDWCGLISFPPARGVHEQGEKHVTPFGRRECGAVEKEETFNPFPNSHKAYIFNYRITRCRHKDYRKSLILVSVRMDKTRLRFMASSQGHMIVGEAGHSDTCLHIHE